MLPFYNGQKAFILAFSSHNYLRTRPFHVLYFHFCFLPTGCSQYGTTFTKYAGRLIVGHNDVLLYSLTEDECRANCVTETNILCKIAEYYQVASSCALSSSAWIDVTDSERGTNMNYNVHIRHCDL